MQDDNSSEYEDIENDSYQEEQQSEDQTSNIQKLLRQKLKVDDNMSP